MANGIALHEARANASSLSQGDRVLGNEVDTCTKFAIAGVPKVPPIAGNANTAVHTNSATP
jgi:cytochrome c5